MFHRRNAIITILIALTITGCLNVSTEAQDQSWREVIEKPCEKSCDNSLEFRLTTRLDYYAALEGDAQGQLGLCKDTIGGNTPKNWEPFAEVWCIAAAKTSYPGAAQFLAEQYANGTFGEAKKSNADKWFENAKSDIARAAALERRYKELKAIWGSPYIKQVGKRIHGVPPIRRDPSSFKPALDEITTMAENGDIAAMLFLSEKHKDGKGKYYNNYSREKNDELYFKWINRAAELGNAKAAGKLAWWYQTGGGLPKDLSRKDAGKAIYWYEKAIKKGLGPYDPFHTNPTMLVKKLRAEVNNEVFTLP